MEKTVHKLEDLAGVLNEEYALVIVSRRGEKSGMDRYYTDKSGKKSSGFYLIVEAINLDGNAILMNITNEEDGKSERVTKWGERVPKEVYEKVGRDKKDDGIIQDKTVGNKERGYLAPKYENRFLIQNGRITHW